MGAPADFDGLLALLRNLPWSSFTGYDQAKQAYASLEMVQDERLWYPLLPTGRPATKPPLMGWLSAALHTALGGWWNGAWRLPFLLAFTGALWLVGRCAAAAGGNWGAFAAVGVLGVNMFSIRLATLVRTDMLLALEVAAAGSLIWRQAQTGAPWTPGRRAALAMVVLAGCMTKGPVIFAFLLPPFGFSMRCGARALRCRTSGPAHGCGGCLPPCSPFGSAWDRGATRRFLPGSRCAS